MGPLSTAMLFAGLSVLRALLFLAAGLLVLLVVVQAVRGEAETRPVLLLALAAGFAATGWISGRLARRVLPPA